MSSTLGIGLTTKELLNKRKKLKEDINKLNNKLSELYENILIENSDNIKKFLKENNLNFSETDFIKIKFYIEENNDTKILPKEIRELEEKITKFDLKFLPEFTKNVEKMAILEKKLEIYNMAKDFYIDSSCKRIGWLSNIIQEVKNSDLNSEAVLSNEDIDKIIVKIKSADKWSYYEDEEPKPIEPELKNDIINSFLKMKSFLIDDEIICIAKIF